MILKRRKKPVLHMHLFMTFVKCRSSDTSEPEREQAGRDEPLPVFKVKNAQLSEIRISYRCLVICASPYPNGNDRMTLHFLDK